jgi:hypothetical protein
VSSPKAKAANHPLVVGNRRRRVERVVRDKVYANLLTGSRAHELEDGLITTIDGTFMAGVNGDKPGIIMKAHPAIGDFYRQEFSLNNAEDFAETRSLTQSFAAVHIMP